MKKVVLFLVAVLCISISSNAQNSTEAKKLLDEVSAKMSSYKNMVIGFSQALENKDAGIKESPTRGNVILSGEKYNLDFMGNNFIFDGKKLVVINKDEKEITVTEGDLESDDGMIYPSKLLTFYKEGYNYKMGKLKTIKGRKIQFVDLFPIDSESTITKVQLGIDAKTKHIYTLIQLGENGTKTTFTISKFKSNQPISEKEFTFNQKKYEKLGFLVD